MNKAKLKSYAPNARRDFIQMIRQRADLLGLTKREIETPVVSEEVAVIEGKAYPKRYGELHKRLAGKIKTEGLETVIERVAYSWFNRFAALRFMEINNFLTHGFRVLSSADAGRNEPEILTHAAEIDLPGLDKEKVIELKLEGNRDAELYKILLIAQCSELNRAMPFLFERVGDETEILLPDNLLASDSVIRKMVGAIDEADWAEVEIIGWLYQFYISEKKDEVIGKTVKSEDIPAATQLFTPNWIVKYMTQNSLGRLWLENNSHSALAQNMEFYIKANEENSPLTTQHSALNPEEIKVLDPACGSGHILVEAYELLKTIYTERGYSSRDIPLLILEKNLFGLDIDERAAQMANFALLMKARRDDRRIFERLNQKSEKQIPNILTVPDSSQLAYEARGIAEMFFSRDASSANAAVPIRADGNFLFDEMQAQRSLVMSDSSAVAVGADSGASEQNVIDLLELFEQGKTLGSLIRIPHGFGAVIDKLEKAVETKLLSGNFYEQVAARELEPFVRAGRMLANKYDCVIANPPYMGGKGMNGELKAFAAKNFPDSKSDLFAMFIERNIELTKKDGFLGFMTPYVWMFLSSYEKLRLIIADKAPIVNLVKPSYTAFFESAIVAINSFVLKKGAKNYNGDYFDLGYLGSAESQPIKFKEAINNSDTLLRFHASTEDFKKIPGSPVAFWITDKFREVFEKGTPLSEIGKGTQGIATTNNGLFVRLWHEVALSKVGFGVHKEDSKSISAFRWFPYNKGGEFRKWYGNRTHLINWQNHGKDIHDYLELPLSFKGAPVRGKDYQFLESVTWSFVSSSFFGVRYSPVGSCFDVGGSSYFVDQSRIFSITGFLCSRVAFDLMKILNPTLNFQVGNVSDLPYLVNDFAKSTSIAEEAVAIARADWDSFETSWDFKRLPMLDNDELPAELTGNAEITSSASVPNHSATFPNSSEDVPSDSASVPKGSASVPNDSASVPNDSAGVPNHSASVPNDSAGVPNPSAGVPNHSADVPNHSASVSSVETAWQNWKQLCDWRIARMQELETENNRLFIEAYGLEDELSPEVPLSQITLARADAEKDTRRLLSYFVGCLMGRYSLDKEGLIYADSSGKGFEPSNYQTFPADDDGIVPVTDMEWFPQEAARQFEQFVRVAFSMDNGKRIIDNEENSSKLSTVNYQLSINLKWIAEQLGGKSSETPIETVRRYFSTSFFKDHLQTYKKRPIYWLFSSGKQKAFECLVYLHRYSENTLPRMRHEYVLPLMSKLTAQIETAESLIEQAASTSERTKLQKQLETFRKKQTELAHFDEKLRHAADLKITLDLDDGVKQNYGKFGDLLAEVKQIAATKE